MTPEDSSIEANPPGEQAGAGKVEPSERFKSIGQQLKKARRAKSLERSEVARQLHLPTHVVDDLEEGRMARLAPIYRRGYINNYAALLGIESSELGDGIGTDPPPALTQVLPVRRSRFRFERYIKFATYLVATIAIVPPLVMVYLNTGVGLFDADRPRSETTRTELMPLTPDESSASTPDTAAGDDAQRPVTASAMPLSPMRSLNGPEDIEAESDLQQASGEAAPALIPDTPALMALTLRLSADSWVEISGGDDQRLEYDLLRADQVLTYEGEPPLNILLGRASAVDLLLDGELVTYDGHDRGDVAELRITRDGAVQR